MTPHEAESFTPPAEVPTPHDAEKAPSPPPRLTPRLVQSAQQPAPSFPGLNAGAALGEGSDDNRMPSIDVHLAEQRLRALEEQNKVLLHRVHVQSPAHLAVVAKELEQARVQLEKAKTAEIESEIRKKKLSEPQPFYPTTTPEKEAAWGSGGTSTDAYLQTSLDGGTTWTDVANFHFLAVSARYIWTLESSLIAAPVQLTAPSDGSMTANTALSGVFGNLWRVKFVTVGTYAGGTTLRIGAIANGLTVLP
jgi:hypothetical protein